MKKKWKAWRCTYKNPALLTLPQLKFYEMLCLCLFHTQTHLLNYTQQKETVTDYNTIDYREVSVTPLSEKPLCLAE